LRNEIETLAGSLFVLVPRGQFVGCRHCVSFSKEASPREMTS
jgi:hypothetical protein